MRNGFCSEAFVFRYVWPSVTFLLVNDVFGKRYPSPIRFIYLIDISDMLLFCEDMRLKVGEGKSLGAPFSP